MKRNNEIKYTFSYLNSPQVSIICTLKVHLK